MSRKYFCDVCGKEVAQNMVCRFIRTSLSQDEYGTFEADMCLECRNTILKPLQEFGTYCRYELENKPKHSTKKEEK